MVGSFGWQLAGILAAEMIEELVLVETVLQDEVLFGAPLE
jgi:hypothetical protein